MADSRKEEAIKRMREMYCEYRTDDSTRSIMIVAKSQKLEHIFTGSEVRSQIHSDESDTVGGNLSCAVCGKMVTYNYSPVNEPFGFFRHADGSSDCFETDAASDEHRLMIELTVKLLHNRINEVTGEQVDIDTERWVGIRENFVIADVRVTSPLQIVAETFYKSDTLALGRRFSTTFGNGYRSYLIFSPEWSSRCRSRGEIPTTSSPSSSRAVRSRDLGVNPG